MWVRTEAFHAPKRGNAEAELGAFGDEAFAPTLRRAEVA